jgi:hypothetical protein
MKTISKIAKRKISNRNNFLIFTQRKNYQNEFQLRIDNIERSLYIKCFPQWIYTFIHKKIDRIYMRIRIRNNNKPIYELLFSGFNFKFSIDFEKYIANAGNEVYEGHTHYQYKPYIVELNKNNCDELLNNILDEFDKLGINYEL